MTDTVSAPPAPPAPAATPRPKSNWAQIVSAGAALVGFGFVIFQIALVRSNFHETEARRVYMSYSEASLRYPEYSEPDLPAIRRDPVKFVQYKNYVSHMLFAYDEILTVYDRPAWRASFDEEIRYHLAYICEDMPPGLDATYFEVMRALLKDLRTKCPRKAG
jgi:hypothetical protein